MFKRSIALIIGLTVIFSMAVFPVSADGATTLNKVADGIYSGYYIIEKADDLSLISKDVSGKYVLVNDITTDVTKSIAEFAGKLIGVNTDMTAPYIRKIKLNIKGAGLFTALKNGADISYIDTLGTVDGTGLTGVGGIAGSHATVDVGEKITFDNCLNHAMITGKTHVGGIIGNTYSKSPVVSITNCKNYGNITAESSSGGISGISSNNTTMTYCVNIGNVTNSGGNAGGLIGWVYGDMVIDRCYNAGNIEGSATIGGIIGNLSKPDLGGTVTNCFNTGNINATAAKYACASGLVGKSTKVKLNISNCYNTGKITSSAGLTSNTVYEGQKGVMTPKNLYFLDEVNKEYKDNANPLNSGALSKAASKLGIAFTTSTDLSNYPYPEIKGLPYEGKPINIKLPLDKVKEGKYTGYYIIKNEKEFKQIEDDKDGKYVIVNDIVNPITTSVSEFFGEITGVNNDITAPQIRKINVDIKGDGLFTSLKNGAKISNISLNGKVDGKDITGVGGIAGKYVGVNAGEKIAFENIENHALITGKSHVGGIIGNSNPKAPVSTFVNCKNYGNILSQTSNAGGLIGVGSDNTSLTNCFNIGNIKTTSGNAGGLIGWVYGNMNISKCYNAGDVEGTATVGGFIGNLSKEGYGGTIENSFNTGNITATAVKYATAGGFVGKSYKVKLNISNCYNIGKVTSNSNLLSETVYEAQKGVMIRNNLFFLSETETEYKDDALPMTSVSMSGIAKRLGEMFVNSTNVNKYPYPEIIDMPYEGKSYNMELSVSSPMVFTGEISISEFTKAYEKYFDESAKAGKYASVMYSKVNNIGTESGIVYSTSDKNPTVGTDLSYTCKAKNLNGYGMFGIYLYTNDNLKSNSTYYVRSYIKNGDGSYVYGETVTFNLKAVVK